MLEYLLFVEALEAHLKLFVLGLHGFAQFLKDLREDNIRETRVSGINNY